MGEWSTKMNKLIVIRRIRQPRNEDTWKTQGWNIRISTTPATWKTRAFTQCFWGGRMSHAHKGMNTPTTKMEQLRCRTTTTLLITRDVKIGLIHWATHKPYILVWVRPQKSFKKTQLYIFWCSSSGLLFSWVGWGCPSGLHVNPLKSYKIMLLNFRKKRLS